VLDYDHHVALVYQPVQYAELFTSSKSNLVGCFSNRNEAKSRQSVAVELTGKSSNLPVAPFLKVLELIV